MTLKALKVKIYTLLQIFIPSLIVVYGILIASVKINEDINENDILYLWHDKLTYVPLFHMIGWIVFGECDVICVWDSAVAESEFYFGGSELGY